MSGAGPACFWLERSPWLILRDDPFRRLQREEEEEEEGVQTDIGPSLDSRERHLIIGVV